MIFGISNMMKIINISLILGNYPHNDLYIDKKGKNEIFTINHFRKIYSTKSNNNLESQ